MQPRLIAIAGPLQGGEYVLGDGEFSIGREPSNRLKILDEAVSRHHCWILPNEGRFLLQDLNSRNGVFVNSVPVRERVLQHGDRIRLGKSVFLFAEDGADRGAKLDAVQFEAGELPTSTVLLSVANSIFAAPERTLTALTAIECCDLKTLLAISAAVSSVTGLEPMQRKLLELMLDVVPADYSAMLLVGDTPEEFSSVLGYSKKQGLHAPVPVSHTAVVRAMRERVAILCNDIYGDEELRSAKSLAGSDVSSLLVVPTAICGKPLGALYVASRDPQARFNEQQLQIMTAMAGIVAAPLENARRLAWLESENLRLAIESGVEHDMVGESARMKEVLQFIGKAAPIDSTVLVLGESGTGKELVARAIHRNSPRAQKPFVAVNCAVLTDTLLESELFGHEKGAFTGAIAQKRGRLEEAHGGTLFLDEIGELASSIQAKLLRALQERQFERVGGTRPIKVDFRLVAATNRDLEEAARTRSFRQDLYYRLNVLTLRMPTLRERREDIPLLANYFVSKYSKICKRTIMGISRAARALLQNYDWPGNVRELENAIERAAVMGSGELIQPEDLPEVLIEARGSAGPLVGKYHEALQDLKKQLILSAFHQARGSYTEAAKLLCLQVNYLHRLTRNMNLRSEVSAQKLSHGL